MAGVTKTIHLGGHVPAELAEQFAAVAAANDRSVSAELRRAVKAHIAAAAKKSKAGAA